MQKIKQKRQIALTRWSDDCASRCRCISSRCVLEIRDQVARCFSIFVGVVAFFFAWPEVPGLKVGHVVVIIFLCCDDVSTRSIVTRLGLVRLRGWCAEGRGEVRGCGECFRCGGGESSKRERVSPIVVDCCC